MLCKAYSPAQKYRKAAQKGTVTVCGMLGGRRSLPVDTRQLSTNRVLLNLHASHSLLDPCTEISSMHASHANKHELKVIPSTTDTAFVYRLLLGQKVTQTTLNKDNAATRQASINLSEAPYSRQRENCLLRIRARPSTTLLRVFAWTLCTKKRAMPRAYLKV